MSPRIISSGLPTIRAVRKLAWACGSFSAGVFLAVLLVPQKLLLWLAGGLGLLGFAGCALRGYSRLRLMLLCWGAAVGVLACCIQEAAVLAPVETLVDEERTVSCRVLDYPELYDDYARVMVRLSEPGLPAVRCQILDYEGYVRALEPGDELCCRLRFRSARLRYGEASDMYTSRGIFLRAMLLAEAEISGGAAAALPQRLRRFVRESAAALFPADVAPFHVALLSGDKSALYKDLDAYYALSRAGLMHVTAVSGMHVSFLVAFVLLLFPNRRRSAILLLPLLLIFAGMTGFTPSVLRAVFMQLCLLLAPLLKRESDTLTSLSLILALLLLQNPQAAASQSLQLSFAAALGIVLFTPAAFVWLREKLLPLGEQAAGFLAASLGTSLGALVLTTPLMALHFGSVALLAPVSNALCLWLISVLFSGGYGVIILKLIWPWAAEFFAWVLALGDRFVLGCAKLVSAVPNSVLYTENRAVWLWLGFVYALALLLWLRHRSGGAVSLTLPLSLAAILLGLCLLVPLRGRDLLRLSVLDVGQGSCAVLEGGGSAVVVDCGGHYSEDYPGDVAAHYLLARQRPRVNALILTHLHTDHCNGVERLLAQVDVDAIYLPLWPDDDTHRALRAVAEKHGTALVYVREDICLSADGWEVKITPPLGKDGDYENGLFVRAGDGELDILIGGDATSAQERRYVEHEGAENIDVLVVSHHGSKSSSGEWVLRRLRPQLALISVGYNTYGHPHEDVLERLESVGAEIYRTDESGHLIVTGKE